MIADTTNIENADISNQHSEDSNNMEKDEKEITKGINELLFHLDPLIRVSGSTHNINGMLSYLEEIDNQFENYILVQWLKRKIKKDLLTFIKSEISTYCTNDYLTPEKMKDMAPSVLNNILQSDVLNKFKEDQRTTFSMIGKNISFNTIDIMKSNDALNHKDIFDYDSSLYGNDFDSDSYELTCPWNQTNFLFLHPDQFSTLAEKLNPNRSVDSRIEALTTLLQIQSSDIVSSNCWPLLREGLRQALLSPNKNLVNLSLSMHSKLFISTSHFAIKEAFLNLFETITSWYYSPKVKLSLPTSNSGIDLENHLHLTLFQIVYLLQKCMLDLPNYWSRYPERYVEEIIENMVDLFALHSHLPEINYFYPLHIFAALDSKALLIKHWLHGFFGQSIFLRQIGKTMSLVKFFLNCILKTLENATTEQWSQFNNDFNIASVDDNQISPDVMEYFLFSYSIHSITKFLQYEKGRLFFPISLELCEDPMSCHHFVITLISFLGSNMEVSAKPYDPIIDCLISLTHDEKVCQEIMCQGSVIESLFQQIIRWNNYQKHSLLQENSCDFLNDSENGDHAYLNLNVIIRIYKIFKALLSNSFGLNAVIFPKKQRGVFSKLMSTTTPRTSPNNINDQGKFFAIFSTYFLKNFKEFNDEFILEILKACNVFSKSYFGYYFFSSQKYCHLLSLQFLELSELVLTPTQSLVNLRENQHLNNDKELLFEQLKSNIASLLQTPRATFELAAENIFSLILESIDYLDQKNLSLLSFTRHGITALHEISYIETQLELFDKIVYGEDFLTELKFSEKSICQASKDLLEKILLLVGNFQSSKNFFSVSIGKNKFIKNFFQTLSVNKNGNMVCDAMIVLELKIILSLCACLDIFLYFEAKYKLREYMQSVQVENINCQNGKEELVIDLPSLYRNYILVNTFLLGGGNEKVLPPLNISESDASLVLPYNELIMPKENLLGSPLKTFKKKNELLRFLRDTNQGLHDTNWMSHCKKIYKNLIINSIDEVKENLLMDLLEKILKSLVNQAEININNNSLMQKNSLTNESHFFEEEEIAIDMIIRYGNRLKSFPSSLSTSENLHLLINFSKNIFRIHNSEKFLDNFHGFDWFASICFLIFSGNLDRCKSFLLKLTNCKLCPFLWPHYGMAMFYTIREEPDELLVSLFGHNIEMILQQEVPMVYSALFQAAIPPSFLSYTWIRQCFVNIIDWSEICHYITIILLFGPDYIVYFCVSLFQHLQEKIINYHSSHEGEENDSLLQILLVEQIKNFRCGDYFPFMDQMAKKHRKVILADLNSYINFIVP